MKMKLRTTFLLVVMLFALSVSFGITASAEEPEYVAYINEDTENHRFATLHEAVTAAQDGDTIVLTADVEEEVCIIVEKAITITNEENTDIIIRLNNQGSTDKIYKKGKGFYFNKSDASFYIKGASTGSLTITGKKEIEGGTDSYNLSSLIYVNSGTLITSNVTITGANNKVLNGGAINIYKNAVSILESGTIISNCYINTTSYDGGGIYVNGTLTMKEGAQITGCTSNRNGGGVFISSTGTLNMNGGTISNCTATIGGGGIYCTGAATLDNAVITNCSAASGAGMYLMQDGTSTTPCEIKSGKYTDGVAVAGGTLNISGGVFTGAVGKTSDAKETAALSISGGWFPAKVTDYIAAGYFATDARSDTPDAAAPYTVMKNLGLNRTNNLNLSSDLKFGFYINNYDSTDVSLLSVKFTMAGGETTVPGSGFVSAGDNRYYAVYEGVSPQFIGTDVTAELYKDGTLVDTFTRSILDYAKALYTLDTAKYGTLVSDLVDYGIAADAYAAAKGYNRGTGYTRSGCEWLTAEASTGVPAQGVTKSAGTESLDFVSANVIFDAENKLRLRVRMPSDGTLTVSGDCTMTGPVAIEGSSGEYYCYLTLKASQYTDMYDFTLKYGEYTVTLNYGLGAYAYSKYNGADGVMKDLALATYRYGLSAKNVAA